MQSSCIFTNNVYSEFSHSKINFISLIIHTFMKKLRVFVSIFIQATSDKFFILDVNMDINSGIIAISITSTPLQNPFNAFSGSIDNNIKFTRVFTTKTKHFLFSTATGRRLFPTFIAIRRRGRFIIYHASSRSKCQVAAHAIVSAVVALKMLNAGAPAAPGSRSTTFSSRKCRKEPRRPIF